RTGIGYLLVQNHRTHLVVLGQPPVQNKTHLCSHASTEKEVAFAFSFSRTHQARPHPSMHAHPFSSNSSRENRRLHFIETKCPSSSCVPTQTIPSHPPNDATRHEQPRLDKQQVCLLSVSPTHPPPRTFWGRERSGEAARAAATPASLGCYPQTRVSLVTKVVPIARWTITDRHDTTRSNAIDIPTAVSHFPSPPRLNLAKHG
ncbi:unnamed protein product, partial [Ectocarpus fasciculatus]